MTVKASKSSSIPDLAQGIALRELGAPAYTATHLEPGRLIRRPRAYWDSSPTSDLLVDVNVIEARAAPGVSYAAQFVVGTGPGLVGGTTILSSGIGAVGAFKIGIPGALLEIVPSASDLYIGVRLAITGVGGRLNFSARLSEVLP